MKRLKILFPLLLSLILAIVICNYRGDVWEQEVRTTLYKVTGDSIADYAKENVDEQGVPYVFYAEQNGITAGKQYNATIVCNYAIEYYRQFKTSKDSSQLLRFKNCVDWLVDNMKRKDDFAIYEFNWQQPWYPMVGVPYTSGMTSGRAIEVFTYAAKILDTGYLNKAKPLLKGFYIPIDSGGFTYQSNNGWWYEELADANMQTPRILDGHIFALTGVHHFWLETKNDSARQIVQRGLLSLKQNLPNYDAGEGWSYYDVYKKRSDKKYHKILTDQMQQLFVISKDAFFLNYFNKWNAYFKTPYLIRVFKENNKTGLILFFLCFVAAFVTISMVLFFASRFGQISAQR